MPQHPQGVRAVRGQRDLLSLRAEAVERERTDRRLVDASDAQPAQLGLWAVLPVPTQREGASVEPQARLSHLPAAGAEPADQAQAAPGARECRSRWRFRRRSTRCGRWTSCTTTWTTAGSIRLFNVLDDFNREGLGIEVDLSLPSARVIRALDQIIEWRGRAQGDPLRQRPGVPERSPAGMVCKRRTSGSITSSQASRSRMPTSNGSIARSATTGYRRRCSHPSKKSKTRRLAGSGPTTTKDRTWRSAASRQGRSWRWPHDRFPLLIPAENGGITVLFLKGSAKQTKWICSNCKSPIGLPEVNLCAACGARLE